MESRKLYHKIRAKRLRLQVIAKMGGKCVRCGETDYRCLQVDHINGGGNKEINKIGSQNVARKVLKMDDWKDFYQLLCSNCNWRKRYEKEEHK